MDQHSTSCSIQKERIAPKAHFAIQGLIDSLFKGGSATSALLDGNRIANLPEILAASGLPHCCLFQNSQAESAAGEAAPWLVRLTPDARLTRQLLASAAIKTSAISYWEKQPGIYLQSALEPEALRQHLRRFLRIKDNKGRHYFFRFWEADMAAAYFAALGGQPEMIQRWFLPREGGKIDSILIPDTAAIDSEHPPALFRIRPLGLPASPMSPMGAFSISDEVMLKFQQILMERDISAIITRIVSNFPELSARVKVGGFDRDARRFLSRMLENGISQKANLLTLLVWELFYGPNFLVRDETGQLSELLRSDADETERFEGMKSRIQELDWSETPS